MKKYKVEYKCIFFRGVTTYFYTKSKMVLADSALEAIDLTFEQETEKLKIDQQLVKCDQLVVCNVSYLQN
jgi:hypothetical protein